jgi:hypothetical protein
VDLVEVDVVGLQAAQRMLDLGDDPAPGVAALMRMQSSWPGLPPAPNIMAPSA